MNDKVITKNDQRIKKIFQSLDESQKNLEKLEANTKADLHGETFLTDSQLSDKLKISRRTLQEYRNKGKLSYIQLQGKILYRSSEVEKMLNEHSHKAFSY